MSSKEQLKGQEFCSWFLPWIIWGVACFFYFLQYFLRVSVSGLEETLQRSIHLNALSLAFVIVREATVGYDAGMAFSLTNVFQLTSGAISLPIIGHLLDSHWAGERFHHFHVYSIYNYHSALMILPISIALSLFFSLLIKEPKCLINEVCANK